MVFLIHTPNYLFMKDLMKNPFLFLFVTLCVLSCGTDEDPFSDLSEEDQINQFTSNSGLNFQRSSSGLRYSYQLDGIGDFVAEGDTMEVFVRGFTLDETIFADNFGSDPLFFDPFNPENIDVQGLVEALKLCRNKTQLAVVMPSSLGFGSTGNANGIVPPDSPIGFVIGVGCINNAPKTLSQNESAIQNYLATNNLTAERTESGLYYVIEEEGDGSFPDLSSRVTVNYHGYLLNGSVFDSSIDRGEPSEFELSGVIQGWQEGIPLFSKGGRGKLLIPHNLGYGCYPPGDIIQPNGVIAFDVHLIDF